MSLPRYEAYRDSGHDWVGPVPAHWQVIPIRRVARLESGHTPSRLHPEYWKNCTVPWFSLADVWQIREQGRTYIYETNEKVSELGLANSAARVLPRRTVMLSRTASVGFSAIMGVDMATTQDFANWICGPRLLPEFLLYVLRSMQREFVRLKMGSTHNTIYMPDIQSLRLALPPMSEQEGIVRLLDRETAKIDALVGEQRRLIGLLKGKRQAFIAEVVTKGLKSDVPMKLSGIEWLGQVPRNWRVTRVKYMASVRNGSTPSRERPDYWVDGMFPWLNSAVVNCDPVAPADQFVTPLALKECHLPIVEPPAIVVGITGQGKTRGMASALLFRATVSQHLAVLQPNSAEMDVYFLKRVLEMAYPYLRRDSDAAGSTKGAITCEDLGNLAIPCPSVEEQRAIVSSTDEMVANTTNLLAEADRAIDLLQERRAALIAAAVTGQVDVRGVIPSEAA